MLALLLAAAAAPAATRTAPIAMGVNGHHFTQPNYSRGPTWVASGAASGISVEQQLDQAAALAPAADASSVPFYYRHDVSCGPVGITSSAAKAAATRSFVRAAAARNLTVLPILFPGADAAASTTGCAKLFIDEGIRVFEIGQEWDNEALLPGRGGDKIADYNQTVYQRLLATLSGMSKGARAAAAAAGTKVEIGVNNGGWLHYAWFEMLLRDQLDFDFVGYHWVRALRQP